MAIQPTSSYTVQFSPQNQGCGSFSNPRMRANNETSIVPDQSSKCFAYFKKFFHCSGNAYREENRLTVDIFQKYLKQKFGEIPTLLAICITNINLVAKKNQGRALYLNEALKVMETAQKVKDNYPSLKALMTQNAFYKEFQKIDKEHKKEEQLLKEKHDPAKQSFLLPDAQPKSPETSVHHTFYKEFQKIDEEHKKEEQLLKEKHDPAKQSFLRPDAQPRSPETSVHLSKGMESSLALLSNVDTSSESKSNKSSNQSLASSCFVQNDNDWEKYDPEKIMKSLQYLSTNKKLTTQDIEDIAYSITLRLVKDDINQTSSITLRRFVAEELKLRKFDIIQPGFLESISHQSLRESISSKTHLHELTGTECFALLECAREVHDHTIFYSDVSALHTPAAKEGAPLSRDLSIIEF